MKSKIKRHSRSVLAVILTLSMLVSCMMVGLIATDAARVTDSGTVGATDDSTVGAITDIQIRGSFNSWSGTANHSDNGNFPFSTRIHLTAASYTFKVVFVENGDNYCGLDSGNSYTVGSGLAQLGWKKGDDISLSISEEGDYSFTVSTSNNKNYISVEKVVNHTVNFGVNGSNGTLTASASIKGNLQNADTVGSDETVTFTASPDSGYVAKWYSDSGCTTPISNTGNTYTATASANLNVYVKFEQVPTTTIYIAKNDYLSKIYVWYNDGTADRAITANFPGDAIDQTVPYNFGGVVYYKYTFALDISTFSFKLNDGSNSRESAAASNYTAGGTYYVQWNGGNTTAIHNMTTGGTYPNYILSYKKTSDSNWIREQFVSGAVAIDLDGDSAYQFFIVRQDWENNAYSDNQWYNSADKTISSSNSHNVYCTHRGTSNIPLTTTDGGEYTFSFGSLSGNGGVTMNIDYPAVSYYLTGWLNGASVTTKDNSRKFTATGTANEYSLTYTFTGNQGGSQYVTIFDGTTAYHPATHKSGSGTAGTTTNNAPGNDPKWQVDATTDQSVTFTWNSDTKVLSWSIAPLTTTYRVIGSATFFGVGWDTSTASSSYTYMMTSDSGPFTYNSKSYDYKSGPHTASTSYGSFDFKVWGSDNTWAPTNDNVTVPSLKKGQEITFYYDSTNGVAYKITGTGTDDSWPPTDITTLNPGDVQYDSLIYNISGGSNNITTNKSTLDGLKQVKSVADAGNGGWWADFTDLLPSIGTNQLYFNITSNGNYTGFYATSNMTFDTTNAPGISVKKVDKDSSYYFVEVSGVDSNLTNLGVYITKDSNNNFTYKFYTIKGAVSTVKTVKVYAKDGAIRRLGTSRDPRSNITYSTFEQHANTFICTDSNYDTQHADAVRSSTHGANGTKETLAGSKAGTSSFSEYTYDYIAKFNKGDTLYITTVLDDYYKTNNYFVRGFSINGTVYELFDKNINGVYSTSFVVPEDWSKSYVEITPIFQKEENANNILKFYVEGFDETVQDAGWGDTLGVYPFYQNPDTNSYIANINNPFGGYPGQPMIFYKGNYYIEVPKSYDSVDEKGVHCTATIKGITLSNLYWDDVHLYTGEVSSHFQTYDFDDLYKIYTEYGSTADFDKIVCAFKYRTKKNNDEPGSFSNAGNYTNGWEVLTDYKGQPVDVFGNVLSAQSIPEEFTTYLNASTAEDKAAAADALKNVTSVVHVISQDYKSNSAGQYGTEWAIYNTSNAKVVENNGKTTIVPSALAIPTASGFDKYDAQTKAFKGIYQALDADSNVKNQPVLITYEKSIYGGGDKADRCDARWFFSKKDTITSSTRIEYSDDLGATWTTDTYNTGTGTGSTTGVKAYFTGKSATAKDAPDSGTTVTDDTTTSLSGVIGSGYYTLKAEQAANYEFVGWYVLRDNYQLNAKSALSHAEIAKNGDVFVARFVKVATGTFTINHRVHPQSQGFGDVYVEAVVKNAGTQLGNKYGSVDPNSNPTSSITISGTSDTVNPGNQYIISGHGNVIEAKFVPDPYGTSSFANFYATVSDLLKDFNEYDYIKSIEINMEGEENYDRTKGTYALVTYDVDKLFDTTNTTQKYTSVTHYSKFNLKTDVNYKLKYTFDTRYYGTKVYEYDQYFTEQELRSYFYSQITTKATTVIELDNQFVFSKAPFESNYREDLTWDITRVQIENNIGTLTATQVEKKTVKATVYDQDNNGTLATKSMTTRYMQVFDADNDADVSDPGFKNFPAADCNLYQPNRTSYTDTEDNNTVKPVYIHHWNIYSEENFDLEYNTDNSIKFEDDGINFKVASKSQLVAQSYSSEFNYAGFEDYVVVPVYSKVKVNQQVESDALAQTGKATLLTITRNHWNNTTNGQPTHEGSYDQPNTNYDRLYVDFMLNYNYKVNNKNVLLSTVNDSNIIVGFVVKSYTYDGATRVYRKNQQGVDLFQTVVVDKSKVDNKNRLEYCYGFNNTQNNSQWGLNFEFTPFIIDTSSPSADGDITYNGNKYSSLLVDPVPLRDVNFYMIGKENTDWN